MDSNLHFLYLPAVHVPRPYTRTLQTFNNRRYKSFFAIHNLNVIVTEKFVLLVIQSSSNNFFVVLFTYFVSLTFPNNQTENFDHKYVIHA